MGQQADITVFDGASTPVSHTLKAEEVAREGGTSIAKWREQIATLPNYAQVSMHQIKRKLKSGVWQTITRVEVPVMEQASGVNAQGYTAPPKVAYIDRFEFVNYAHERSTETTKRIAMQLLINAVNGVSTSVAPVSTGIAADLHQRNISVG